MKTKLIITTVLAALFGAPVGFRTANAAEEASVPSAAPAVQAESDNSTLALLCKGAGVSIDDVRWRVASGLDPKQAVDAALAQKAAAPAKGSKKGGK